MKNKNETIEKLKEEVEDHFSRELELMQTIDENFWSRGYPKMENTMRKKINSFIEKAYKKIKDND